MPIVRLRATRALCTVTAALAAASVLSVVGAASAQASTVYRHDATYDVGGSGYGIAVDSLTSQAFVPNFDARTVTVLDLRSGSVLDRIPVVDRPFAVAADRVTGRVYVTYVNSPQLTVIDGQTRTVLTNVELPGAGDAVAVDTRTHAVFVRATHAQAVYAVDGTTDTVTGTAVLAANPDVNDYGQIALNPETGTVYTGYEGADREGAVAVIDPTTLAVQVVPVPQIPEKVVVDPISDRVYLGGRSSTVQVFDMSRRELVEGITLKDADEVSALAVDPQRGLLHAVTFDYGDHEVSVDAVDIPTGQVSGRATVPGTGYYVSAALDTTTGKTYVSNLPVFGEDQKVDAFTALHGQTLTFTTQAPDARVGGAYLVKVTGGESGQPVVITAGEGSAGCTVTDHGDGTASVAFVAIGACVLEANQAGADDIAPAETVRQTMAVRETQSLTLSGFPSSTRYGAAVTLTAVGGASGRPVVFASNTPEVCTAEANGDDTATVTAVGIGVCRVVAQQPGDSRYAPVSKRASITVKPAVQTVTFESSIPRHVRVGDVVTVSIGRTSTAAPADLASKTPAVCTVERADDSTFLVAMRASGQCRLVAGQAADAGHGAARAVDQVFPVRPARTSSGGTAV